jgi:hypothetical protein
MKLVKDTDILFLGLMVFASTYRQHLRYCNLYVYIKNSFMIYFKKKYKQRSTKHTHKTKDRVTRTPLKTNNDLQNIHIKLKIE